MRAGGWWALAVVSLACHRETGQHAAPMRDATAAAPLDGTRAEAGRDVAPAPIALDAGSPRVLTIRVVNVSASPLTFLTNQDTNELIHTRKLRERRQLDASPSTVEGELVKFFPVGQEPLCSSDAAAGYGGLGQPEPRTLAPGEAVEFVWDGQQRHEVLNSHGVCMDVGAPEPGRYRFEFDQPYNMPMCNRPVITWPLAPEAPRVIDVRCAPRPPPRAGGSHTEN